VHGCGRHWQSSARSVKELMFSGNDLGGYESMVVSQALSKFLTKLAAVKLLDLSHNDLQDYDIELLCQGLGKNRTIESVLLSGNPIGDEGAKHLMKIFGALLFPLPLNEPCWSNQDPVCTRESSCMKIRAIGIGHRRATQGRRWRRRDAGEEKRQGEGARRAQLRLLGLFRPDVRRRSKAGSLGERQPSSSAGHPRGSGKRPASLPWSWMHRGSRAVELPDVVWSISRQWVVKHCIRPDERRRQRNRCLRSHADRGYLDQADKEAAGGVGVGVRSTCI
jgi:hypothetical protein